MNLFQHPYKYLVMKLFDISKGENIMKWYRFYLNTTRWTREQIVIYQEERLQSLIRHAYQHTEYYKNIFEHAGIKPSDIRDKTSLQSLPFLTRDIIRDYPEELRSTGYHGKLLKGSSSGTTGIPLVYYQDKTGNSASTAAGYVLRSLSGWKPVEKTVNIWGNQSSIKNWNTTGSKLKNFLKKQYNIPSTDLNNHEKIRETVEKILRFRPKYVEGYVSSIYTLVSYMKEHHLKPDGIELVLTAAENLEEHHKELFEEVLGPVSDRYGSGEIPGIANRPAGHERYYIFDPHVIAETVDSGINGMKDIVLTDLNNYAMPLIRYKIGDLVDDIREPEANAAYPFSWFSKIHGRSTDIISLPNGMKFHPVNIFGGTLFRTFENITRHKVVWNGKTLHFIFETTSFSQDEDLRKALSSLLQPYDVDFSVEYTQQILPSAGGKYKYFEILSENNQ